MSTSPKEKEGCEILLYQRLFNFFVRLVFETTEFGDCFYQGYYHKNLPDGKGIIIYKNGDCYFGKHSYSVTKCLLKLSFLWYR